jgi:hypothetical protein
MKQKGGYMAIKNYKNMILFPAQDINIFPAAADDDHETALSTSREAGEMRLVNLKKAKRAYNSLSAAIGIVQPGTTVKFVTDGAWSMHQMLHYCLELCGPAKVMICTWTITEEPVRAIMRMKDKGMIKDLSVLVDHRIATRSASAMQLLKSIATDVKLIKSHAKITVILGEKMWMSIVGSANFSRNRRLEAGTIFTDHDSVMFDFMTLNKLLQDEAE